MSKNENVHLVVCSIILFLEITDNIPQILEVKNLYDEILDLVHSHHIPLPLNSRSLNDLQNALKKALAVRNTMGP